MGEFLRIIIKTKVKGEEGGKAVSNIFIWGGGDGGTEGGHGTQFLEVECPPSNRPPLKGSPAIGSEGTPLTLPTIKVGRAPPTTTPPIQII